MRTIDRRTFLGQLGRGAGAACLLGALGPVCWGGGEPPLTREVEHYEKLDNGRIRCGVCPRHCELADGEAGYCRARMNQGGRHYSRGYGKPCILNADPIEKLPLNHFRPGTQVLTVAVGGCNLRCLYCQNYAQSQKAPGELKTFDVPPAEAVAAARKQKIDTIAFSYTEPISFLEYVHDIAVPARKAGLHVVVATNGFVEPEPMLKVAKYVDAFAVTLKAFDDEVYRRLTTAWLDPVLRTLELVKNKAKCWVEVVNLVVPTYNDDLECIGRMAAWLKKNLGPDVPLHFERFVPMYQLANLPRTAVPTLEAACQAARQAGLRYTYTSNVAPHDATNTYCAACGTRVIQRLGFKILENTLKSRGECPQCHQRLPGVWA